MVGFGVGVFGFLVGVGVFGFLVGVGVFGFGVDVFVGLFVGDGTFVGVGVGLLVTGITVRSLPLKELDSYFVVEYTVAFESGA